MKSKKPVIGIASGREFVEGREYHAVRTPIVEMMRRFCDAVPFIIPALGDDPTIIPEILQQIDGLFLPGGKSNVDPSNYGCESMTPGQHDQYRDKTTLALIKQAIALDMPILGICRGHQELNVALGGDLYQKVHEIAGRNNHLPDPTLSLEDYLKVKHPVNFTKDGLITKLGLPEQIIVNTSHGQAINKVAPTLQVEALADDGTIEAVSRPLSNFVVGVQWHPEMEPDTDPIAKPLFTAFGNAAKEYRNKKA